MNHGRLLAGIVVFGSGIYWIYVFGPLVLEFKLLSQITGSNWPFLLFPLLPAGAVGLALGGLGLIRSGLRPE